MKFNPQKLFKIIGYVVGGIFCFYLLAAFLIIPLTAKLVIQSQGTKILAHPVKVKWIFINPFLMRLTVQNFEIQDAQKNKMVGFDRFFADFSFLGLFKKEYRFEKVALDGLYAKAVLSSDGKINLLELQPVQTASTAPTAAPTASAKPASTPAPASPAAQPLPLVIVDEFALNNGTIQFEDRTVSPNFNTSLNTINITVKGITTRPEDQLQMSLAAQLGEKGKIGIESKLRPLAQPLNLETAFKLNSYALQVLSPYVGKYTGMGVEDGKVDIHFDYRIADNKLTAQHKILVQKFTFGGKVESKDALHLPFKLGLALLEDSQGKINITLPVTGNMNDPKFHIGETVRRTFTGFFMKLITKPFSLLASVVGGGGGEASEEEFGYVRFVPGQVELSAAEKEKLTKLVQVLKDRPKLVLEIQGGFDPDVDWKTMKRDNFEREYAALLKESTKTKEWALKQLYGKHFGVQPLWKITKEYKKQSAEKLNAEIERQLIENAPVDRSALDELANQRAKTIYAFIEQTGGLDNGRFKVGSNKPTQSSLDSVPLELALTVYE